MPLPELRRRICNQTASRIKRFGKISSKNTIERRDTAHKFSLTIKNARKTFLEANLKAVFKKLRDREQVEVQRINQSNITQYKAIVHFDRTNWPYPSSSIVPKSDVLLVHHGGEAGEPSCVSGHVPRATGINEPYVLQTSILHQKQEE